MFKKITFLLMCALTLSAADKPNNATDTEKSPIGTLQQLRIKLNKIATTDYTDDCSILNTMITPDRQSDNPSPNLTIMGIWPPSFFTNIFKEPSAKYKLVETSLTEATNQFLEFNENNPAAYDRSTHTLFCTAMLGTKPMLEYMLSREEINGKKSAHLLRSACEYGNVEAVEYLTHQLPVTHMLDAKIPTLLDFLKSPENTDLSTAELQLQQERTECKNAATIRFEYMLHKNPDTQKVRKTCPFEECKRLLTEAIKAQKAT